MIPQAFDNSHCPYSQEQPDNSPNDSRSDNHFNFQQDTTSPLVTSYIPIFDMNTSDYFERLNVATPSHSPSIHAYTLQDLPSSNNDFVDEGKSVTLGEVGSYDVERPVDFTLLALPFGASLGQASNDHLMYRHRFQSPSNQGRFPSLDFDGSSPFLSGPTSLTAFLPSPVSPLDFPPVSSSLDSTMFGTRRTDDWDVMSMSPSTLFSGLHMDFGLYVSDQPSPNLYNSSLVNHALHGVGGSSCLAPEDDTPLFPNSSPHTVFKSAFGDGNGQLTGTPLQVESYLPSPTQLSTIDVYSPSEAGAWLSDRISDGVLANPFTDHSQQTPDENVYRFKREPGSPSLTSTVHSAGAATPPFNRESESTSPMFCNLSAPQASGDLIEPETVVQRYQTFKQRKLYTSPDDAFNTPSSSKFRAKVTSTATRLAALRNRGPNAKAKFPCPHCDTILTAKHNLERSPCY